MFSWFQHLSREQRGVAVYTVALLVWLCGLELPGHFGWLPIPTLSSTVWGAIRWWHPVALMVAVFLFTLWGHLDRGWSAGYLIAVAVLIVAAVVTHAVAP